MYCPDDTYSSSASCMEYTDEYETLDLDTTNTSEDPPPPEQQPEERITCHTVQPLKPMTTRQQRNKKERSFWEWDDYKRIVAQRARINTEKMERLRRYTTDKQNLDALTSNPLPKPYPSLYINMGEGGQGLQKCEEYRKSPFQQERPINSPYAVQLKHAFSEYRAPETLLIYEETKQKIIHGSGDQGCSSQRPLEDLIARNVDKLMDKFESSELALVGDMDTFPMTLRQRDHDTLLRPVIIDAVGVTMLYHKAGKKKLLEYGLPRNGNFVTNMKLIMKPIVQLALYYLALGHKIIIAVPICYEPELWLEDEPRVDNIVAFEHLLRAGVVNFLAEHTTEIWMASTRFFADEIDGLLVSNSFFWKHIVAKSVDQQLRTNDAGLCVSRASDRLVTPSFFGPTRIPVVCHHFTFQIDASQKFDLKGYGGHVTEKRINDKRCLWVKEGVVRYYHEDTKVDYAVRLENQLRLKDQVFQMHLLENLYLLPCRLQRAYHVMKYISEMCMDIQEPFVS
ncbi:unnamed protein product, partial [Mesorhabditis belari]|uniref:Zc3h12a-like Ribonuclease NYN domain-containing protein n=1 Tax=Mesorhabditis belari TaxID=2138241 RepID=A0AAF3EZY4_9BILA